MVWKIPLSSFFLLYSSYEMLCTLQRSESIYLLSLALAPYQGERLTWQSMSTPLAAIYFAMMM